MMPRLTVLLLVALPLSALAQGADGTFYLGGSGTFSSDPYVGGGTGATGIPIVGIRGDGFSVGTDGASAVVLEHGSAALNAFLKPRFFALTDPDSPALDGIDRDVTLDAGLSYSVDLSEATSLDVTVAQEITGEHDGQEADLRLTQRINLGPVPLGVYAGATWRSEDLSSYLYGVRPSEARPGRPAFGVGATTTPYIGVQTALPLSESVSVFGSLQADFLEGEIERSPIVDEDTVMSLGIGVQFSF